MKTLLIPLLGLCLAGTILAQDPADTPPAPKLSPEELEELLGPIALYPDALVSLILPASTYPSDVVLGARHVTAGGSPESVQDRPWDASVKALVRYPDTLKWLDENLEWTTQVGEAFINQPADVMEAIQRLRGKARSLGNLVDTPQQRIVEDESYIRIIPARPEYIYEPRYDPGVIFYQRPALEPFLFFSVGFGVGPWLNYDCDWHHRRLYRGDWHEGWDYRRDHVRRDRDEHYYYINNNLTNTREWRPDHARHRTQARHVSSVNSFTSVSSQSRTRSRDENVNVRERKTKIVHPKPIADTKGRAETIRRAEAADNRTRVESPVERDNAKAKDKDHDKKMADSSRGRVATTKSKAPDLNDDKKRVGDARVDDRDKDNKKPGPDSDRVNRRDDDPPKKKPEVVTRSDAPPVKHATRKDDEPKHVEAPKHKDAPKRESVTRPDEPPKRKEVTRHEEPKRKEAPPKHVEPMKKKEAPPKTKHVEAPKRVEPARHEEPKRHDDSSKKKKKEDEKDKK